MKHNRSGLLWIARLALLVVAGAFVMLDGPEWHDAVALIVGACLYGIITTIDTGLTFRGLGRLLMDQQEVNLHLKPLAMELDRLYEQEIRLRQRCHPLVPLSPKYEELASVQQEIKRAKAKWDAATEAARVRIRGGAELQGLPFGPRGVMIA